MMARDSTRARARAMELESQLRDAQAAAAEARRAAEAQQALQAKALETAMQSLVRLCVVAPTVNVHLGEQTLGCKAPLPQVRVASCVLRLMCPVLRVILFLRRVLRRCVGLRTRIGIHSLTHAAPFSLPFLCCTWRIYLLA